MSKRLKRLSYTLIAIVMGAASLWTVAAIRAGNFHTDREVFASLPGESSMEEFSKNKKFIEVETWRVAYIDEGEGEPVILLHGCPFHAYEWRDVIPRLTKHYRVIAPDLLGLGDTVVRLSDDYRLPNQMKMVVGLMDKLGIVKARIVGHDHGGATAQLMMKYYPDRIHSLVLTNAEAYDQWPSAPEITYLKSITNSIRSPVFRTAIGFTAVQRDVFSVAVHNQKVLTDEVLAAYVRPHIASSTRWLRLRQFYHWQLDREHNLETLRAVDGMRRFNRPTLLLWGRQDTNFGPAIAERLAQDIPGFVRLEWLENSAHMPMQEEPEAYAEALLRFFAEDSTVKTGQPK
ncbi:MAG: alpha/beta hydrolase [Acidobacteria bacterium]|nr:alpha/beta hydrolase [Acidobacteriota bacterium]